MTNTVLFFACILFAVGIGVKLKINIGLPALVFAFVLGTTVGGMTAGGVISLFPIPLFVNFLIATFLFGFAGQNGTLRKLAQHLLYLCRGSGWVLGLLFFVVTVIIAGLGAGGAAPFFLSAICFSMAIQSGINPLLVPIATWTGSMVGGCVPWASGYAMNVGQLEIYYAYELCARYVKLFFLFRAIFYTLLYLLMFFLLNGYKVRQTSIALKKPEAFNEKQLITLRIILFIIVGVVVSAVLQSIFPSAMTDWLAKECSFQMLATLGIVLNILFKTAPYDEVIKNHVPWDTLLMLSFCGIYMALATPLGIVDYMSALLQNLIPEHWILPGSVLIMCILSFFVSGGVIIPMMLPILSALSTASGVSVAAIYAAIQMGLTASSISPFSQGGAAALTGCSDESLRRKLIRQQTLLAGVFSMVLFLTAILGGFQWMK
jgi:di/tricarboxylate transporter